MWGLGSMATTTVVIGVIHAIPREHAVSIVVIVCDLQIDELYGPVSVCFRQRLCGHNVTAVSHLSNTNCMGGRWHCGSRAEER
jgi:hypothetical protein